MTSFFRLKGFLGLLFFSVSFYGLQAQSDLTNFLQAGKEDASKLMSAYMDPVIVGLSYGLNGGWYHTAKAHKTLGFDIGISANAVFIPSSQSMFKPADLGLMNTQLIPSDGQAPTIIGPDIETNYQTIIQTPDGPQILPIEGPPGLDFEQNFKMNAVLAPTLQVGLGIYANTDLKFRYIPTQTFEDTEVTVIGLGVMHDIKQHIHGLKLLPFDLSVLAGYSKIYGTVGMGSTFDKPINDPRRQTMDFEVNAWLIQALISKKLSVFTFYGGIGYNTIKTSSDVLGSYTIYGNDTQNTDDDVVIKDPVSLAFKNNSFRLTGGVRLKLGPVYFNGDYSVQEYNTLSVGFGFTVR